MMRASFQRHLSGQTPIGVFSNLLDRDDRITVGGWYLAIHFGAWRLTFTGFNPKGYR